MSDTDVLERVDLDVDLTETPACEFDCDQPAAWVATLSICRHQLLACNYHHARTVLTEPIAMANGGWKHAGCGARGSYILWRPL